MQKSDGMIEKVAKWHETRRFERPDKGLKIP